MANAIRKWVSWTEKPPPGTPLDLSLPINDALQVCLIWNDGKLNTQNYGSMRLDWGVPSGAGTTIGTDAHGTHALFPTDDDYIVTTNDVDFAALSSQGTYLCGYKALAGTSRMNVFGYSDNFECVLKPAPTGVEDSDMWTSGFNLVLPGGINVGEFHQTGRSFRDDDASNEVLTYHSAPNLAPRLADARTRAALTVPPPDKLRVGDSTAGDGGQKKLYYLHIWTRPLQVSESLRVMNNPNHIFWRRRRTYFIAAAAGNPSASGAATLGAVQAAGVAVVHKIASGAAVLTPLQAAGVATRRITGSGAAQLAVFEASGTAKKRVPASGAAALALITATGTAKKRVPASGTATLAALQAAGVAAKRVSATGAAALTSFVASGVVTINTTASGGASLAVFTADGVAAKRVHANGAASLIPFTAAGVASLPGANPSASGAATLGAVQAAGVSIKHVAASGAATLAAFTASGVSVKHVFASGAPSLPLITAAGIAIIGGAVVQDTETISGFVIDLTINGYVIDLTINGYRIDSTS